MEREAAMSEFDVIEFPDGSTLTVDEDGEIVDAADMDDPLAFVARNRHEARQQLAAYERYIAVLDRGILKKQSEKKMTYPGDVVISVRTSTYSKTDSALFSEFL